MMEDARSAAERLRLALDLFAMGERMKRQQIRRRYPTADDATVEHHVQEWLHFRPGAEHGDASGRPVPWPRHRD